MLDLGTRLYGGGSLRRVGSISSPEWVRCSTSTLGYRRPFNNLIGYSETIAKSDYNWLRFKNGLYWIGNFTKSMGCMGQVRSLRGVMDHGASEFRSFRKFWGHYDVITGGWKINVAIFRPEVTFGVDAPWLQARFQNRKKFSRDHSSARLIT